MSEKEIIENNKLIAEFMGAKMVVENYNGINIIEFPDKSTKDLRELKYHLSWDWLMQVVEKIENLQEITNGFGFLFQIDNWSVNIKNLFTGEFVVHNNPKTCRLHSKFESVYKSTVEFIKLYNQHNL